MGLKRGQIMLFVVIALLLVIVIGFLVINNGIDSHTPRQSTIHQDVQYCLSELNRDALYFVFLQGGYFEVSDPKLVYYPIEIPYYFKSNTSYVQPIASIESEIATFLRSNVVRCFSDTNVVMEDIVVTFFEEDVFISYIVPTQYSFEGSEFRFDVYEEYFPVDLITMHAVISGLIEESERQEGYFPLGYLVDASEEYDFNFEVLEPEYNQKIVTVTMNPLDERREVLYNFALDYEN
jgi:hypothetical protein